MTVAGPNCPGIISPPARCTADIMPGVIHAPGNVGVALRSGTLTYEVVGQLTSEGISQSTCIAIGGDPLPGTAFVQALRLFEGDPATHAVVLVGETGGSLEQEAAEYIQSGMSKPVVAFVAGVSAPPGRRMGHAGAITSGVSSTAAQKKAALSAAGAVVVDSPAEIGATTRRVLAEHGLL